MTSRNHNHVAIDPDHSHYWDFVVPMRATTGREQVDEILSLSGVILDAADDFVTTTELSYHVDCFPVEHKVPFFQDDVEPVRTIERVLEDESGLSRDELEAPDALQHDESTWLPQVSFDRNEVLVHLASGDRRIDRTTDCIEYRAGDPIDRVPSWDPIDISITHAPNLDDPDVDSEYVYHVSVELRSDIWFEPTEIGATNREYLSAYLQRIADSIPYESINRYPVRNLKYELADIF